MNQTLVYWVRISRHLTRPTRQNFGRIVSTGTLWVSPSQHACLSINWTNLICKFQRGSRLEVGTPGVRNLLGRTEGISTRRRLKGRGEWYTSLQFSVVFCESFLPLELERATGLDPVTFALATQCSAIELRPHGTSTPNRTEEASFKDSRLTTNRYW